MRNLVNYDSAGPVPTGIVINQSTHLFEYNSHSGWLQNTNTQKFDIK